MVKTTTSRVSKAVLASTVASIALFTANPVFAQGTAAPAATAAADDEASTDIVVLGTRRTDRSSADSASPIDVISAAEINSQPAADLLDVVKNIVPSFYVGQNSISDASTFVRSPSLRGLAADEILVQLNGKRFNRSALVQVFSGGDTALSIGSQGADISSIPSIAIGSLQVLRDGATAQYGSDAIGGVINYGLRKDTGLELQARYGQYFDNGGDGKSYQISGNAGTTLGDNGFINVSGEYFDEGQTSRGATRPIALQFAANNPGLASQLPNFPNPVQIWGSSPKRGYKLILNGSYGVTDNSELYFFGNLAQSKSNQSFNYRAPRPSTAPFIVNDGTSATATRSPGANGSFVNPVYLTPCPINNATCPAGSFVRDTNIFNFSTLYPAGFTPRFFGVTSQAYGTIGYKGKLDSGFTYDFSTSISRNSLELSLTNSLNASFGPQSLTAFNAGKLIQTEIDANVDLTYPIEAGFASPITLAGGFEYRRESYQATAGDVQSYAAGPFAVQRLYDQTGPATFTRALNSSLQPITNTFSPGASGYGGTSPSAAGTFAQKNYALYIGAETDLTSALSVGLAGRYENYNTFGGAFVGKANFLFKLADAFSLRGTVGTGFHAPSPGQSNIETLSTTFSGGNQVQVGTYTIRSPISRSYGATSLGPERSTNFGAGFIIKPSSSLSLTVDAYLINVRDRITITQQFNVDQAAINAQPALAAVGVGGSVQYFNNGFDSRTKGIDVVGTYRTEIGGAKLNASLAYNYNKSEVTKINKNSFGQNVIDATRVYDVANLAPKHRIVLSTNLQKGNFSFNARGNYYSSWSTQFDYPIRQGNVAGAAVIGGQRFGAKFTSDLDLSYTFAEHYTLTLGVNNLFNTKPDRIAPTVNNPIYAVTGSTADGQIYPRNGGPFGFNGGFWYGRIRVKY